MLKNLLLRRYGSQNSPQIKDMQKMLAWSIHSYGEIEELQLDLNRCPIIGNPDEVLIGVKAASVNPIDSAMLGGYGRASFQVLRNFQIEFPLILGRDFSGTVISKGHNVKDFKIGDDVYGFIPIHRQGSFAEAVLASKCHILPKPKHLTYEESASMVYSTMTAWSSLFLVGNLAIKQTRGLRVLVLGGSGGVGNAAIQILKSQGCVVYTTCSTDAVPLVKSLEPDVIFDRNESDFIKNVECEGKYHVILDAANMGIHNIPHSWQYETYITLNSPLLVNTDKHGIFAGLLKSAGELIETNASRGCSEKSVRWGYFVPSNTGFRFIDSLIRKKEIKPIIQEEFEFKNLPKALEKIRKGHSRGKIVVSLEDPTMS